MRTAIAAFSLALAASAQAADIRPISTDASPSAAQTARNPSFAAALPPTSFILKPSVFGDVKLMEKALLPKPTNAAHKPLERPLTPLSGSASRIKNIIDEKWRFMDDLVHADYHEAHQGLLN